LLDGVYDIYGTKSYSQEGEDMVLRRIFEKQTVGFYVDVGAHHPRRFSNTNFFYRRGWRGINIEPSPDALRAFRSSRPRDINLQLGVSDGAATLTYYCFDEPALNTFDPVLLKQRLETTPYKLLKTIDVSVQRLDEILKKHLPAGQAVDFLSIDVEGLDLSVLKSNEWQTFRPRCVLVEALKSSLEEAMKGNIFHFMKAQGYDLLGKTFNTLIFVDPVSVGAG
jgi:FkbM family methyltransferase